MLCFGSNVLAVETAGQHANLRMADAGGASDGAELVCAVPEQPAEVTAMAAARARAKDLFITEFENLIKIV